MKYCAMYRDHAGLIQSLYFDAVTVESAILFAKRLTNDLKEAHTRKNPRFKYRRWIYVPLVIQEFDTGKVVYEAQNFPKTHD